jgi:hypothetical protein
MNRGGAVLLAAGSAYFLLSGIATNNPPSLQGSETETETPTVSDFFLPTPTGSPSGTETPMETFTETGFQTWMWSLTESPTATGTATETDTATPIETASQTETCTETPMPTLTQSPSATNSPSAISSPAWVVISEVAWAGTAASAYDEWIELWNPGGADVSLAGWTLTDGGDIHVALAGTVGAGGYFLLERTDDTTVDNVPADQLYAGGLANSGEALFLLGPSGTVVDSANADGGPWPAGAAVPYGTMERTDASSVADAAWCSNDGLHRSGADAGGNPINGTPRQGFSGFCAQPTFTPSRSRTLSPTPTGSETGSATPTPTVTLVPTAFPPHSVVINEVAWAGTAADSSDEWIELWNPGSSPIDLAGWRLTDGGDVDIFLAGSIDGGGFFILERGGDDTLSDIAAGQLYTGALSNSGEELRLLDPSGSAVDAAGARGAPWPAGSAAPAYASMERVSIEPALWASNTGWVVNGRDAAGNPVRGTPGRANSALFPTPTPTEHPKTVLINEFLPKPGSDWNRDGSVDYNDEFIELYNAGTQGVDIGGWMLDDKYHGGSRPFVIPGGTWIGPKQFLVFFRTRTHVALNESSDEIWLLTPDGNHVDGRVFTRTRWPDSAWGRYPDGESVLRLGFPPTPGEPNRLPDDILNPEKKPLPVIAAGWRRVMCGPEAGPLAVGAGFLTTGDEGSIRMAEAYGWYTTWNGRCYAWTAPYPGRRLPYSNLAPGEESALQDAGWWWEWWYLR